MRFPAPLRLGWLIVPLCSLAFFLWADSMRTRRVEIVTHTDAENAIVDVNSPTGYRDGKRWLIVPEHNNRSYQWIAETQQMFAEHRARIRHTASENAPAGRPVYSGSPYRWWLGLLATADHLATGQPYGLAVERAALWADPALCVLSFGAAFFFIAWWWGFFAAGCFSLGTFALYPLAGSFLPGMPNDHAMSLLCRLWGMLLLVAAIFRANVGKRFGQPEAAHSPSEAPPRTRTLFCLAGVAEGLGLWVNATDQIPILAGLFLGGLFLILCRRKLNTPAPRAALPWRTWAISGVATSLAAYLIEYAPHFALHLEVNHPLYAIAWLGAGEILAQFDALRAGSDRARWTPIAIVLSALAIAALPFAAHRTHSAIFFGVDEYSTRLTFLLNGVAAKNFAAWIARDGVTLALIATLLPVAIAGWSVWLIVFEKAHATLRQALALALGPVLITGVLGLFELRTWNACDAALLALFILIAAGTTAFRNRLVLFLAALAMLSPGIAPLIPIRANANDIAFTRSEVQGLLERQIAHWLADHADAKNPVVFLPPERTVSWCFHGGFRGVGSANSENRDGLTATVRIATATTADQALDLITQHTISYLVLPSWDHDLEAFAQWSLHSPEDAFVMALRHWALPPWLQAIPYRMPNVPGFENESVVILKVTEDTNRVIALSRLADYFVEMDLKGPAASLSELLERYPMDLNALVALAAVEKAQGRTDQFAKTASTIEAAVDAGADRALPWDRRVSLAVVLAQDGKTDLAREQIQRCLSKISAARIRSLTTNSLFRLQVLAKAFQLKIEDAKLHALALELLPPELRGRL